MSARKSKPNQVNGWTIELINEPDSAFGFRAVRGDCRAYFFTRAAATQFARGAS